MYGFFQRRNRSGGEIFFSLEIFFVIFQLIYCAQYAASHRSDGEYLSRDYIINPKYITARNHKLLQALLQKQQRLQQYVQPESIEELAARVYLTDMDPRSPLFHALTNFRDHSPAKGGMNAVQSASTEDEEEEDDVVSRHKSFSDEVNGARSRHSSSRSASYGRGRGGPASIYVARRSAVDPVKYSALAVRNYPDLVDNTRYSVFPPAYVLSATMGRSQNAVPGAIAWRKRAARWSLSDYTPTPCRWKLCASLTTLRGF